MGSTGEAVVPLPALSPRVHYRGVPKRYEETKPVLVRDLTHRKILDLGLNVHQKTLDQCAIEKASAVAAAEESVWAQAETIRQNALEQAAMQAAREQEKLVRRLNKAHEKAVRQEAMRVRCEMEKLLQEQIEIERAAGQKRLEQAVEDCKAICLQEMKEAVAGARQEEQQEAKSTATKVAIEALNNLESTIKRLEENKSTALADLTDKMTKEKEAAVMDMKQSEQRIAALQLAQCQNSAEQNMNALRQKIGNLQQTIYGLEGEIRNILAHRKEVVNELLETRKEYQQFINKTAPFEKDKSDYMIPPLKSVNPDMI